MKKRSRFASAPIEEAASDNTPRDMAEEVPIRQRRVTCDLLSWTSKWFSFNNSACAAKCLVQRRRGGSCSGGVCVCRG
uniref:Defensin-1a n=1 Tax=Harpegnathos saltator TaxID=610380 RepID=I2HB38_HARSA|nr:TPA_exp: defensin-1a [Harpegnathos saltator]